MLRAHALPTLLSLVAVPNHHLHRAPPSNYSAPNRNHSKAQKSPLLLSHRRRAQKPLPLLLLPRAAANRLHLGVVCDKTLNPIGDTATRAAAASRPTTFAKPSTTSSPPGAAPACDRIDPINAAALWIGAGVLVLLATWLAGAPPPPPTAREDLDEIYELPPLSPAEQLVAVSSGRPCPRASAEAAGERGDLAHCCILVDSCI